MKKLLTFGLATTALLVSGTQVKAMTLIDNFNNKGFGIVVDNLDTTLDIGTFDSAQSGGAGMLVNEIRDVSLELIVEPDRKGTADVQVDLDMTQDDFRQNNEIGVASIATLTYDDGGTGLGGGAGVNLLPLGSNISLFIKEIDLNTELELSLTDFGGTTISSTLDSLVSDSTVAWDFVDFAGVDLTKVTTIALKSTTVRSTDLSFDYLRIDGEPTEEPKPTPEPAAVIGLLFSLGCGALSKKKKQA